MADTINSLDDLLGPPPGDPPAEETAPTPVALTGLIPNDDTVPEEFRGKSLKEALDIYAKKTSDYSQLQAQLTRTNQDKADLVRTVEGAATTPVPTSPDLMQSLVSTVVETKLLRVFDKSPELAPYSAEIMGLLNTVQPQQRFQPEVIESALTFVRGKHFNELMQSARARETASPTVTSDATGAPPAPTRETLALDDRAKNNVFGWFSGDEDAIRSSLQGGG